MSKETIIVEENVVMVTAKDWAHFGEQTDRKGDYEPIQGIVVGFLIDLKEGEYIVVSHTLFPEEDQIRSTTVIPWAMVEGVSYLVSERPEEGDSLYLDTREIHGQEETFPTPGVKVETKGDVIKRMAKELGVQADLTRELKDHIGYLEDMIEKIDAKSEAQESYIDHIQGRTPVDSLHLDTRDDPWDETPLLRRLLSDEWSPEFCQSDMGAGHAEIGDDVNRLTLVNEAQAALINGLKKHIGYLEARIERRDARLKAQESYIDHIQGQAPVDSPEYAPPLIPEQVIAMLGDKWTPESYQSADEAINDALRDERMAEQAVHMWTHPIHGHPDFCR